MAARRKQDMVTTFPARPSTPCWPACSSGSTPCQRISLIGGSSPSTYLRTTEAVGAAIDDARFEDPAWVENWDVVFADLFLDAHDADRDGRPNDVPRPWRLAFDAPADLPPLRHVLLGINAHVNYDLPQALLAVISDEDFTDPVLIGRRKRDHERIDAVLASRVAAENGMLGPLSVLDRLLRPLNQRSSKRFLREAREKVWVNVEQLQAARLDRAGRLPAPTGRVGGAQRREDRRSARPGAGAPAVGGRRVRRGAAASVAARCRART